MSFKNKVVIITGAASGIGAATARGLAKQSAQLTLVDKNSENLKKIADEFKLKKVDVLTILADISRDEDLEKIVPRTINAFGRLDVLVNCAGVPSSINSILIKDTIQVFDKIMATNTRSAVFLTQQAAPFLVETKGNIVNILTAQVVTPNSFYIYGVSKACLQHFTKCVALELGQQGVRVNSIMPGFVNSNIFVNIGMDPSLQAQKMESASNYSLLKKNCECEEIADLIEYLASDKAKSVTGVSYLIDNGIKLQYEKLK